MFSIVYELDHNIWDVCRTFTLFSWEIMLGVET